MAGAARVPDMRAPSMQAVFVYVRGLAFHWVLCFAAISGLASVLDALFGPTAGPRPVAIASGLILGRVVSDVIVYCLRRRAAGRGDVS